MQRVYEENELGKVSKRIVTQVHIEKDLIELDLRIFPHHLTSEASFMFVIDFEI